MMKRKWLPALLGSLLLAALCGAAQAQQLAPEAAQAWLSQLEQTLAAQQPLNRPQETVDPARGGQALFSYGFGTVLAGNTDAPRAQDMAEIDIRTDELADCRGLRVGMTLADALDGASVQGGETQLCVLGVRADGIGWSWAYVGENGVYGVEYVTFGGEPEAMREYTLTYLIDGGYISSIRLRVTESTQPEAEAGLRTAQEIASRQQGELYASANSAQAFSAADMQAMGAEAIGVAVEKWVARAGEPQQVQTLPGGRLLLYEGAAVELGLNAQTGEEVVRAVSATGESVEGPRGLRVGMSVQEAAALFACRQDVYAAGGVLYLEGEAMGEPPCGELTREDGGAMLRYLCQRQGGETGVLEIGIQGGLVAYWRLSGEERRAADGE